MALLLRDNTRLRLLDIRCLYLDEKEDRLGAGSLFLNRTDCEDNGNQGLLCELSVTTSAYALL